MKDVIENIKDEELKKAILARRSKHRGRPKKNKSVTGTPDNHTKVCLNVPTQKIEKIREICFLETKLLREVIEEGLDYVISKYEQSHGEIIPNSDHHIKVSK